MKCDLRWCESESSDLIFVNENIGDGCFRVEICKECASILDIKPGHDLPSAITVRHKLKVGYLRRKIARKLAKKRDSKKEAKGYQKPRYDDIYFKGVEWLNENG